jgi:6,7-dimethyl-8-ribityllumazine synthase
MSSSAPQPLALPGAALRVAIAAARYNQRDVDALLRQVTDRLQAAGVRPERITVVRVPGSNELPSAMQRLCARRRPDVGIALGVIIRGGTMHYELVAQAASQGLMRVALDARVPVINGVIVAETERQARARCRGRIARGTEFAEAALEMAALDRGARR